ncbi:MAG: TIGR04086 family membrane protein [Thermaerobacter sp.]|nr:TIGR04086 family membrane protein [Thermaerobacter sp.]
MRGGLPVMRGAGWLNLRAVGYGLLGGVLTMLILAVLLALVGSLAQFAPGQSGFLAGALGLGGVAMGGGVAARLAQRGGLVHGVAVGWCFVAVSLLLSHLMPRGVTAAPGLLRLAAVLASGAVGGVVGLNL